MSQNYASLEKFPSHKLAVAWYELIYLIFSIRNERLITHYSREFHANYCYFAWCHID